MRMHIFAKQSCIDHLRYMLSMHIYVEIAKFVDIVEVHIQGDSSE